MKFDDIKVHEIAHLKLGGERVYVVNKGIDGTEQWVSCKRILHTHDEGDIFRTEQWTPEELISSEEFQAENSKDRSELLDALRQSGIMVLNDQSDTVPPRDPHAN